MCFLETVCEVYGVSEMTMPRIKKTNMHFKYNKCNANTNLNPGNGLGLVVVVVIICTGR